MTTDHHLPLFSYTNTHKWLQTHHHLILYIPLIGLIFKGRPCLRNSPMCSDLATKLSVVPPNTPLHCTLESFIDAIPSA